MKILFSILLTIFSMQLLAQNEIPFGYNPEEINSSAPLANLYATDNMSHSSYLNVTLFTNWETIDYNIQVTNRQQAGRSLPAEKSDLLSYEIYHLPTSSLVGYGHFKYCGLVIDISYLPKGFYLIKILKCDGTIDVKTIFI